MSIVETTHVDPEAENRRRERRRRSSVVESSDLATDGSLCFSDSDDQSWHSPFGSTADECRLSGESISEIEGVFGSVLLLSDCGSDVDLESGVLELKKKSRLGRVVIKDCRICHLSLVSGGGGGDQEITTSTSTSTRVAAIELGCSCKGDLAAAHKQCAEKWFKIKGDTTCEICGATALNVASMHTNEADNATAAAEDSTAPATPVILIENQSFWHGRRIMKFLLACMIFAFVISWLFHYNVLSSS